MRKIRTLRLTALMLGLLLVLAACGGDSEAESALSEAEQAAGGSSEGGSESAGGSAGGNLVENLRESGTVRVGTKYDQPLFGVNTPSGVEGFDAEVAKIIVDAIYEDGNPESHIEWQEAVSANREPFLQNDVVDMVAATYTINDERDELVDFAGPYYVAGQDIMVAADNPLDIQGVEDLNNPDVTTCTAAGSTSLENLQEQAPEGDILTFEAYSDCATALSQGRADAVSTDNVILIGLVNDSDGEFMLVDNPFTEEPYGIGVPEDSDLRCFANEALAEAYESGAWAEAWESTAGQVTDTTPEPPELNNEGC